MVSRRGAYLAYLGSGEFPVRVRVLGSESLAPGSTGLVRLHLADAAPLLPGDRFVLRESGRDETVGGGEVLDVAPVLPASKARPDRSIERVIAEHGWLETAELAALTGDSRPPTVGRWVVAPEALAATQDRLRHAWLRPHPSWAWRWRPSTSASGRVLAVLAQQEGIAVEGGRARPAERRDPLADHPFLAALAAAGATPPDPTGVDRAELREMVRRGLVVERDGIVFHPTAIDTAAAAAADPAATAPGRLHHGRSSARRWASPASTQSRWPTNSMRGPSPAAAATCASPAPASPPPDPPPRLKPKPHPVRPSLQTLHWPGCA